jgi:transcriptional regulator with XRE-family HTH domain
MPIDPEVVKRIERGRQNVRDSLSRIEASARALNATGEVAEVLAGAAVAAPDLVISIVDLVRDVLEDARRRGEEAEDEADIKAAKAAMARIEAGEELPIPYDFAMRIVEGESTIKVHREWRGMSQVELARKAKLTQGALSDIERGRRTPGMKAAKALAKALGVPIGNIVMD